MMNFFKLNKHNTSIKTELIAGFTSFFASVYIIIVNPSILSQGGIKMEPLIIATVLSSLVGCLLVSFLSNTPLIIMPGMGINALFTYTLVNTLGLTFYEALGAVFASGVLFVIIAITPLSNILFKSIPSSLKEGITVGIGLFIAFLGFQKAGVIISDKTTFLKIGNVGSVEFVAFIIILIVTLILFIKNVPGAFLISIFLGTTLCLALGLLSLPDKFFSFPNFTEYNDIFFKADLRNTLNPNFWIGTFSLTLVLVFENIGLLHGQVDGMLGAPEKRTSALRAISYSVIACGLLGTSPPVSTVEGTSGIAAGGRTGLTSLFTGLLFLASLFFIPIIKIIPDIALSPILIIIGFLMLSDIKNIDFTDMTEGFPAFLTLLLIPLTFSIIDGMALGFISYPLIKILTGKIKDINIPLLIISIMFGIYLLLLGTH